jgi:serine/threonine-protein kinase
MAELGTVLGGRYRLDAVLGQGGMATIFRATDAKLGREVAVKVLRPEYGVDPEFVQRFSHEARAAASLNHPNIVSVYDFGTDPAGPYIVMEQVAGGDLSLALGERGVLPPTAVARTGQQVADALAAAHARGLVHRDIKPGNILLSPDGRVQVADFGIAQAAADSPVTSSGLTLGSVLYFSPEQARGDDVTPASDVYSLGLVMYELLTGRRAFSGDSPAAVAVARLSGGIPSPMSVRPDTPPGLDAIVRWCLDLDPAARPSAAELSSALARFIADPSSAAYAPPAPPWVAVPPGGAAVVDASGPIAQPRPPGRPGSDAASGPWGWLAAGLGLIVIVASGILLFLLFSGIGEAAPSPSPVPSATPRSVRTPDFVGKSEADALRLADRRGLEVEIEYVETDGRPGRVLEQLPDPGVQVPVGTTVAVTVGTRAETVVVPDVHGMSEVAAANQLTAAGLRPGQRAWADDQLPEGYVISTDPRAGVSMTRDSAVDYVLSRGPRRRSSEPSASPGTLAIEAASGETASPEIVSATPSDDGSTSLPTPGTVASPTASSTAPGSIAPESGAPGTEGPATGAPATGAPATGAPATGAPATGAPASAPAGSAPPEGTASPSLDASEAPPVASAIPGASPGPIATPVEGPEASASPSTPGAADQLSPSASPDGSAPASPDVSSTASPGRSLSASPVPSPMPSESLVLVGDFRCLDLATARAHIEDAGLLLGATIPADPPPGDDWLVQEQLPDAGTYLPRGSNVDLVLVDPMEPCPGG